MRSARFAPQYVTVNVRVSVPVQVDVLQLPACRASTLMVTV